MKFRIILWMLGFMLIASCISATGIPDLETGCVSHLPFDGNVVDRCNNIQWDIGTSDYSYSTGGNNGSINTTDDFLVRSNHALMLDFQTTDWTVMFCMNTSSFQYENFWSFYDSGYGFKVQGKLASNIGVYSGEWKYTDFKYAEDGAWHCYATIWDGTDTKWYMDGVLTDTIAGMTDPVDGQTYFNIGGLGTEGDSVMGQLDDWFLFNISKLQADIVEHNNTFWGNPSAPVGTDLGYIDLMFKNMSSNVFESVFGEGENFDSYINWSDLNTQMAINETDGFCNFTIFGAMEEDESSLQNKTICAVGCDNTSLFDNFTFDVATNITRDDIRIEACHTNLIKQDLIVDYGCGSIAGSFTLPEGAFPLCSNSSQYTNITFDNCSSENDINLTISSGGPVSQSIRIDAIEINREIDVHVVYKQVFFNETLQLWSMNHSFEYYEHGQKLLYGNCSSDTMAAYTNSTFENITIVNAPPVIIFGQVSVGAITYNLTNDLVIEYATGEWNWTGAIIDNDLAPGGFNVTWLNSSQDILQQNLKQDGTTQLQTQSSHFRDFSNPYNLSVVAHDTNGSVSRAFITFNVTDSNTPSCSGLGNANVTEYGLHNWSVSCTDNSIFEFSLNCTNGFNYTNSGMNETSYSFTNATRMNESIVWCNYSVSDGHTKELITEMLIESPDIKEKIFDDTITIKSITDITSFDTAFDFDRYNFTITTKKDVSYLEFNVNSKEYLHTMPNNVYHGWLISGDRWIDFMNPNVDISKLERINDTSVRVRLWFLKPMNVFDFNSIGVLNTLSGTLRIGNLDVVVPEEEGEGGGGGGGSGGDLVGGLISKCGVYADIYKQCYTLTETNFCQVGCGEGLVCSSTYRCVAPTITDAFIPEAEGFFTGVWEWLIGLFGGRTVEIGDIPLDPESIKKSLEEDTLNIPKVGSISYGKIGIIILVCLLIIGFLYQQGVFFMIPGFREMFKKKTFWLIFGGLLLYGIWRIFKG